MPSYQQHIQEVFIRPIRSVLAIDDLFPTLDAFVGGKLTLEAASTDDARRLNDLLLFCRSQSPQWIVDVHDGTQMPDFPSQFIRQCDLLILDYNLDGADQGDRKSVGIIRSLASSSHFNLVIVYTSEPLGDVFTKLRVALSEPPKIKGLSEEEDSLITGHLDDITDRVEDIYGETAKWMTHEVYLHLAKTEFNVRNPVNKDQMSLLLPFLVGSPLSTDKSLLQVLVRRLAWEFRKEKGIPENVEFTLQFNRSESPNNYWVLAGNVFLALVSKDVPPRDLTDKLQSAIIDWEPSPNRLVLAKLRAELESAGIGPDNEIIADRVLQAYWLNMLLRSGPVDLKQHVEVLVDRQTELLTDLLRKKVTEFTGRVIDVVKKSVLDPLVATRKYLGVDLSDKSTFDKGVVAHNTHVSTKPASGKNLTTGHVLELGPHKEIWVILSPACDLEMERPNGRDLKKHMKPWMPFTALKLHKATQEASLSQATRGSAVFLNIRRQKRQQFSMFKTGTTNSNPVWEEFFAAQEGGLNDTLRIKVARFKKGGNAEQLPDLEMMDGEVVAQLRSEYAANLVQRLTAHLARIGLDYQGSMDPEEEVLDASIAIPPADKI